MRDLDRYVPTPSHEPAEEECGESEPASMEDYRVYLLGPDGHVVQRVDIVCSDEDTAKERAQQLAQDNAIELWQGDRKIAVYQADR